MTTHSKFSTFSTRPVLLAIRQLRKSFISRFMALYLVSILLLVLVSSVIIWRQSSQTLEEQYTQIIDHAVDRTMDELAKQLAKFESLIRITKANNGIRDLLEPGYLLDYEIVETLKYDAVPFLEDLKSIEPAIAGIRLYLMNSKVPEYPGFIYRISDIQQDDWYQIAESRCYFDDICWIIQDQSYMVCSKIYTRQYNAYVAMLTIAYQHDDFVRLAGDLGPSVDLAAMIVADDRGTILDMYYPAADSEADQPGNLPDQGSDQRYYEITRLIEPLQLQVTYRVSLAELQQGQRRSTLVIVLSGFGALLVIISLAFLLNRQTISRFGTLLRVVKHMQQGDFSVRSNSDHDDDIGELSHNIDIMADRIDELVDTVTQSRVAEKDAQLMALQAQISPHFLYNTLDAIKMMAEMTEAYAVSDAICSLGAILRYNISEEPLQIISLQQEIDYLRDYMDIQKLAVSDQVSFNLVVDESLSAYLQTCGILKFLIQPLIENAIIHGLTGHAAGGYVHVSMQVNDRDRLLIDIRNNGKVMSPDEIEQINTSLHTVKNTNVYHQQNERDKIGLNNVQERIRIFYGPEYGISAQADARETLFSVHLPLLPTERS